MKTMRVPSITLNWRVPVMCALLLSVFAVAPAFAAGYAFLEVEGNGLEDLGYGWAYEGWVIVNGAPVSTGVFTVSADGMLSQRQFAVHVDAPEMVEAFVLTIEPVPDADPAPSAVHLLAGDFSNGSAMATVGHPAALGDDFLSASGPYILNAPSGGGNAEYFNGIWWLDPNTGPGPTLQIPALPAGWAYEGWVVGPDGPLSTGRFTSASGADSDGAGITGGPAAFPPFPGQDFINPPMDLTGGYAAVISVEPDPDNSPNPFVLKPLVDMNIEALGAGVAQDMMNNASAFPTMHVTMLDSSAMMETAHLSLNLHGLEDLGDDAAYEGWLIVDGSPVSTGVFTVDENGLPSQSYFPTHVSSLDAIDAFVLTIEPVPDSDPSPSAVHLLGGDFIGSASSLSIDHAAALGTDFSGVMGSYILAAPSGGGSAPYVNGIWWLDPAGPMETLVLPELPDGWVYEGWVAGDDGPMTTGRFTMASGMDSDGAGPASGPEAGPPFPGQDFVNPAIDLTSGYAAVISVEPEPDNSSAPFTLKPLMDPSIDDVGEGVLQPMSQNLGNLPMGKAQLLEPADVVAGAHALGLNDTLWQTDLEVYNGTGMPTTFTVQLLKANQANMMPESVTLQLDAYMSVRYADAFDELFSYEGAGALRVLVANHDVKVSTRTYTTSEDGSYGQAIPSIHSDAALSFGDTGVLTQLSYSMDGDSGFRSNIGFLNGGMNAVDAYADLYRADGTYLGTIHAMLEGLEQRQITNAFAQVSNEDVAVGYAVVWTDTPGAKLFAYGSVVDNKTGDSIFVAAQ